MTTLLEELSAAIIAPNDIDSIETTVPQGLIRRAHMRISSLEADEKRRLDTRHKKSYTQGLPCGQDPAFGGDA